jgi:hypothetical protein
MCYEIESWHWKARAKEMHKAQTKPSAVEKTNDAEVPTAQPPREQSKATPPEKVPA